MNVEFSTLLDIFPDLTEEELLYLQKSSVQKKFKKGEIIFFEGDSSDYLFFLRSGIAKIYKTTLNNGKDITLNYILPKSFIGEFAVIKKIEFPFSAEMETDGEIIKFPSEDVRLLITKSLSFCQSLLYMVADKVQKNYEYCENLMEKNVKKKIAKFLKEHEDLFFKLNKNKIASILNITPETFSRTLKELKKEGLIIERTVVKINKQKIEEILSD
ncbi:Crp/Fnr family transcriptional regulator [Persephonella atlantica]|uniref:Crp/Fnr family transcriptional regulator n=1 Tax=Persephonella atlantica TaxID=2699429 RepID=A0ABS1GHA4_9AQUI|nr:Crp/Fnr family transcriptional regulator [Persephonella atlantica]MBK3332278.1 Crp/Fnr family transcriptional regulator [Persephonella atlantica]